MSTHKASAMDQEVQQAEPPLSMPQQSTHSQNQPSHNEQTDDKSYGTLYPNQPGYHNQPQGPPYPMEPPPRTPLMHPNQPMGPWPRGSQYYLRNSTPSRENMYRPHMYPEGLHTPRNFPPYARERMPNPVHNPQNIHGHMYGPPPDRQNLQGGPYVPPRMPVPSGGEPLRYSPGQQMGHMHGYGGYPQYSAPFPVSPYPDHSGYPPPGFAGYSHDCPQQPLHHSWTSQSSQSPQSQKSERSPKPKPEKSASGPERQDTKGNEDEEPPSRTIEARGFKPDVSESTIEDYFENTRRSGGENVENVEIKDDAVYVTFATADEVQTVLKKNHEFDKTTIKVKLHTPAKCYKNRLLITGLLQTTGEETLRNYIEARSQGEVIDIAFAKEPGKALVTFDEENIPDLDKTKQNVQKKPLTGCKLDLSQVPVTDTIAVQGVKAGTSQENIQLYFEGRRSGNKEGHQAVVKRDKDTGICFVSFDDCDAVDAVLSSVQQHKLDGAVLSVAPYIQSFGLSREEEVTPVYNHPDPFTLETLNKYKCAYLQKTKNKEFKHALESCNTDFTWLSEDSATFKCTLSESMPNASEKVTSWRTDTEDLVSKQFEKIEMREIMSISQIWEKCRKNLDDINTEENAVMMVSTTKPKVVIVGAKDSVEKLEHAAKSAIQSVEDEYNRKKEEVVDTVKTLKPLQLRLLLAQGFPGEMTKQHQHLHVEIKLKQNEVFFKGQVKDVTQCKLVMFEKINTFCSVTVSTLSDEVISFLDTREVKDFIVTKLKTKSVVGSWDKSPNGLEIMSTSDKDAKTVAMTIKENVEEHVFTLESESTHLLDGEKWKRLQKGISDEHGVIAKVIASETITLIAVKTIFHGIHIQIQNFLSENSIFNRIVKIPKPVHRFLITHREQLIRDIDDDVRKFHGKLKYGKANANITVECCKEGLDKAIGKLKDLAQRVMHRRETLKERGMMKFVKSDKFKTAIADIEKSEQCIIENDYDESEKVIVEGGSPVMTERRTGRPGLVMEGVNIIADCSIGHGRQVHVVIGDITKMEVDVIVNAANNRLDHIGGLARAISVAGGPAIQRESTDYIKRHKEVPAGNAVPTTSGRLPCKMVVHAVGPVWSGGNKGEEGELQDAIMSSIECADRRNFKSIAIPALSSGIFGYPPEKATRHIVEAIERFYQLESPNSQVNDVYLVDISHKTLDNFLVALKATFGDSSVSDTPLIVGQSQTPKPRTYPKPALRSNRVFVDEDKTQKAGSSMKITVVTTELAKQKADVLVNSSGSDLNLSKGHVSKSILACGGQLIQDELNTKYPNGIQSGEIAITSGGRLPCQKVFHIALSSWIEDTKPLATIVTRCLEMASKTNMKSIAFPALGTGILGFPRDLVAKTMNDAVKHFKTNNRSLEEVFFVVYHRDRATVKAFEQYVGRSLTTEDNASPPSVAKRRSFFSGIGRKEATPTSTSTSSTSIPVSPKDTFKVEVNKGEISNTKVDVIVNSTASNLDLTRGAVSLSLLKAGGQNIQDDLNTKYKQGLNTGEIAITTGGNLPCKEVYHVCMADWKTQSGNKPLADIVTDCLKTASDDGHTSIAFPALGTGNLGYPRDVVAQTMFSTLAEFQRLNKSLKTVTIVIYHKDVQTSEAFEAQKHHRSSGVIGHLTSMFRGGAKSTGGGGAEGGGEDNDYSEIEESLPGAAGDSGGLSITVKQGDITREGADCIVNSTNTDCDLSRGAVSIAIAKLCGKDMTDQCKARASDMREKGVISTEVKGLNCKYIIHVAGDHFGNNWKDVVLACLAEAEKLGDVQSVAFPLLGTGAGHLKADEIANIMSQAFRQFQVDANNITSVRVVVFDPRDVEVVKSIMMSSPNSKSTSIRQSRPTPTPRMSTTRGFAESLELHFFSDDRKWIDRGLENLKRKCKTEIKTKTVNEESVGKIPRTELERIKQRFDVDLEMDGHKCEIFGLGEPVGDALVEIMDLIRQIEKNQGEVERATLLSRSVKWCYIEGNTMKEFDKTTNAIIEKAFNDKKKTCKVQIAKKDMDIDFDKMEGKMKKTISNLSRRDLIQEASKSQFDVPKSWSKMKDDDILSIVVAVDHKEFIETSQLFKQTVGYPQAQVINVTRIQNKTLYQQYTAKKAQLEKQNPSGTVNERRLWHGTSFETIMSINTHGYNRSYCGKNATAYGQGVYFAVNAKYSASGTYSSPDASGHKYMYLAKVLTGVYTVGNSAMRTPPQKPNGKGQFDLCDSVVDNLHNPNMFVVFNDTQAYPEYLVEFTV